MNQQIVIRPFEWLDLEALARCYANGLIWADEPWNENRKCPKCPPDQNNYGISFTGKTCPKCGTKLIKFWKVSSVKKDIQDQLSIPQAVGFLAIHKNHVVGFTWGYPVKITIEMTIPLLGLTIPVESDLAPNLASDLKPQLPGYSVGYIDEVGVRPSFRGREIGKELTRRILQYFLGLDLKNVFLRTDERAETAVHMYEGLGFILDHTLTDPTFEHRRYWTINLPNANDTWKQDYSNHPTGGWEH